MIRLFLFLCLLLVAGSTRASLPQQYRFEIFFRNVRSYPVHVETSQYMFPETSDELLVMWEEGNPRGNPDRGKSVTVFSGFSYSADSTEIQKIVPDGYMPEISANGKTISLDKAEFLKAVKRSDYGRERRWLIFTTAYFYGTISDSSLCP